VERSEQDRLRNDVEEFCQALRPIEDTCYLERRFNDQVVTLERKHDLLGMPIPKSYGGRGADMGGQRDILRFRRGLQCHARSIPFGGVTRE
jgi:alkylation response protein AidB-like acyl-CoA dehydrogenase